MLALLCYPQTFYKLNPSLVYLKLSIEYMQRRPLTHPKFQYSKIILVQKISGLEIDIKFISAPFGFVHFALFFASILCCVQIS